jgi:hypothetical protein
MAKNLNKAGYCSPLGMSFKANFHSSEKYARKQSMFIVLFDKFIPAEPSKMRRRSETKLLGSNISTTIVVVELVAVIAVAQSFAM